MDNKENNFHKDSSVILGAIFMCNRMTKKECFQRKVFGLPSRLANFIKKIKAGMVLFLFEHEERKLYGVFEATSDGALNIMPDAFTSSGKAYPAQILFKRIWFCKPLSEDEFCGAISENYFAPYKFNFGLKYEQVSKLIQLFSLKKIRIQPYQRPGIPYEVVRQLDISYPDNAREIENHRSIRLNSDEHKAILASEDSRCRSQHELYQMVSCGTRRLPDVGCSTSESDHAPRVHFPVTMSYDHGYCHTVQGHGVEFSSTPLGMRSPLFAQELSSYPRSSIKTHFHGTRNQLTLQCDPKTLNLPMLNSQSHKVITSNRQEAKNRTFFPSYESSKVGIPFLGSESSASLQGNKHASFPDFRDPVTKCVPAQEISARQSAETTLRTNSGSVQYQRRSEKEDDLRKQYCMMGSTPDYIPLAEDRMLVNSNSTSSNLLYNISEDLSDMQKSYSSDSECYNDYDKLTPKYLTHDKQYEYLSPAVNSTLHSDNEQRRTSVFSRISKTSQASWKKNIINTPEAGLSLDQLLNVLSNRRDLWSKVTKSMGKHRSMWNDGQIFEPPLDEESVGVSLVSYMEGESVATVKECSELPFLNFKRRRKVSEEEAGSEMHHNSDSNKNEGSMKKRRRLVRPSFLGEEIRTLQVSSKNFVSGCGLVKDNQVKSNENKDSDPSTTRHEDIGNKNSSVSSICPSSVATDDLEVNLEGLRTCRNNISSGGMGQLSVESCADLSNAFTLHVEGLDEKVNRSQAGSCEQSVLQNESVHGDEECNKVEIDVLPLVDRNKTEPVGLHPLDAGEQ
ncbi:uncharacterized protein [Typha latifolia]|uniref:uncharacterized protein n=1 Tax=Typha latifolia TaxID=4733 RepID=UPI003C30337B